MLSKKHGGTAFFVILAYAHRIHLRMHSIRVCRNFEPEFNFLILLTFYILFMRFNSIFTFLLFYLFYFIEAVVQNIWIKKT